MITLKFKKLFLAFIMILMVALSASMNFASADTTFEIYKSGGSTVYHYSSTDPVMIPTTFEEKTSEFRGVWVATVYNLNMPVLTSETQYKAAFQTLLNQVKAANMNAIVFQVRPNNDAFYDSAYAPWSKWLTGTEGVDPGWDVLGYMIEQCHLNGIEFHAWLNPYRVANSTLDKTSVLSSLSTENFARQRPDLVIAGNIDSNDRYPYILNPGEPEVKTYINNVVSELITLYDVDGIHFDDYFYPYSGISSDTITYNTYKEVGETIEDFRRENVNDVVRGIKETIDAHNATNDTSVRFGISPFGLWGSGIEGYSKTLEGGSNTGPTNTSSYLDQYADSRKWVEQGWLDYICPQVYWQFTHSTAPYADVVDWWASITRGTGVDLIIGHAISSAELYNWNIDEINDQLLYNQQYPEIVGEMMYSAAYLEDAHMDNVVSNYWTQTPLNIWADSNVLSPVISIDGSLDGSVYRSNVTITLTSVDQIFYKIDSGVWTEYTTPISLTEDGTYALYVKAVDSFGEESLIAGQNITIDKVNSDVPVISVTGEMIGDEYVLDSTVSISANETIWVAINHGSIGEWIPYTGAITLDDTGNYYIRAKTITAEGIESIETALLVKVTLPCYSNPTSSLTGTGEFPNFQEVTFSITHENPVVFYQVNGGDWLTYSTPILFSTENDYLVNYKNDDDCAITQSVSFTVDETPPLDPIITVDGGFDGYYYTETTTVSLAPSSPDDTVMYRVHNGSIWSAWKAFSASFELVINATYTVEYYAIDPALNQSEVQTERIRLNIPANEHNVYVIRDGEIVTYYDSNVPILLPTEYTEKSEEIRAVWVATVSNIDVPLYTNEAEYKSKLITMLNRIEANNFNTIFFQVRPMNDAFYPSSYAPFSRYLTGVEGQDPGWDVLTFLIEESHKRGIEFHAWLNPYRVSTGTQSKEAQLALLDDMNFAKLHPDMVLVDNAGKLILNPGELQVQAYIKNVIRELLANYDVDGIHFDDYFYSYNGMSDSEDADLYNAKKDPGQSLADWRRENIDTIIEDIHEIVVDYNEAHDTFVKFGISPFGIWLSGGEEGSNTSIYTFQSYKDQFADTKKWIEEGWLDYVVPQLYWQFDHQSAPFADLVDWWAALCEANNVDLIIGHGFYRYDDDSWTNVNELPEQLRYISQYDIIVGSALFSYRTLLSYDTEVVAALARLNDYYWTQYPSFPWESTVVKQVDPVCEDGETLVEGQCVVLPPECEDGETLVEGQCVVLPPECEDGETLVEGECVVLPPECEDGETLVEGQCVVLPPECEDGETLVEGQCVVLPPVCGDGEELIDGECVIIENHTIQTVIIVVVSTASAGLLGAAVFLLKKYLIKI